jgi:hypothetical protein
MGSAQRACPAQGSRLNARTWPVTPAFLKKFTFHVHKIEVPVMYIVEGQKSSGDWTDRFYISQTAGSGKIL